jgi:phage-related protein
MLRLKKVPASFFKTKSGSEPVRDFLKKLKAEERRMIGSDIAKIEYGWPIGMPAAKPLGGGLHEVRSNLPERIGRVFFYIDEAQQAILLHAIVKKTQKTPPGDIALARARMQEHKDGAKAKNAAGLKSKGTRK